MSDVSRNKAESPEMLERKARAILDGTGSDAKLAARVAHDAQLVIAGDLPAEEFWSRYHDTYLEKFGRDDRPAAPGGQGGSPDELGEGGVRGTRGTEPRVVSRRDVLAAMGGAGAGMLFLGALYRRGVFDRPPSGSAGGVATGGGATPVRYGMVVDLQRCDGCLKCVQACRDENGLSDGAFWIYVFAYQEQTEERPRFLPRLCQHCSEAPCVLVCPTTARHRREDGLVLTDYDVCIGCRYCEVACPYGVNYFQWGEPESYGGSFDAESRDFRGVSVDGDPPKGVMGKCNFCPLRQDDPARRGTTACAEACPMDVLHFGDLNDPDSDANRYLEKRRAENGGDLPTFRLLEDLGTEPNIIYIGQAPSSGAEVMDEWPVYEQLGFVEDRRTVLEGPKPWFEGIGGGT